MPVPNLIHQGQARCPCTNKPPSYQVATCRQLRHSATTPSPNITTMLSSVAQSRELKRFDNTYAVWIYAIQCMMQRWHPAHFMTMA